MNWFRYKNLKRDEKWDEKMNSEMKRIQKRIKPNMVLSKLLESWSETHFGFWIFEIWWKFWNWKIGVSNHKQPTVPMHRHHSDQTSVSARWDLKMLNVTRSFVGWHQKKLFYHPRFQILRSLTQSWMNEPYSRLAFSFLTFVCNRLRSFIDITGHTKIDAIPKAKRVKSGNAGLFRVSLVIELGCRKIWGMSWHFYDN